MNVLPEYLEGNGTGSYTPEQWLDEVKDKNSDEIIQEGTPMDAEHFNHMEQGIHNNSLMLALLLENVKHTQQSVESVDGEELEVTLTNTKDFYFNNSVKTVALANMRSTLDYRVITEVQGNVFCSTPKSFANSCCVFPLCSRRNFKFSAKYKMSPPAGLELLVAPSKYCIGFPIRIWIRIGLDYGHICCHLLSNVRRT